jgi:hypothetical protein
MGPFEKYREIREKVFGGYNREAQMAHGGQTMATGGRRIRGDRAVLIDRAPLWDRIREGAVGGAANIWNHVKYGANNIRRGAKNIRNRVFNRIGYGEPRYKISKPRLINDPTENYYRNGGQVPGPAPAPLQQFPRVHFPVRRRRVPRVETSGDGSDIGQRIDDYQSGVPLGGINEFGRSEWGGNFRRPPRDAAAIRYGVGFGAGNN